MDGRTVLQVTYWSWGLSLASVASVLLLAIYRITLHPLARFPGRRLATVTQWYEFYHDVLKTPGGQYSAVVKRMHDEYGPIVRVTPDEIHIRDADFFYTLYEPGSRRDKHPSMARMTGIPKSSFGTIAHDLHRLRRAPNGPMFSKRAINGPVQDLLCKEVETLTTIFDQVYERGEIQEFRSLFLAFASVFSSQYYIGYRVNFLDDSDELEAWYRAIEALPKGTPLVRQFPWITQLGMRLPRFMQAAISPHLARMLDLHRLMQTKARDFLENSRPNIDSDEGVKRTDLPPTLFHAIERANLPPEEKSFDRLWQEGFNLFIGGLDTSSRAMANAAYFLLTHDDILERFLDELDTAMPDPHILPRHDVLEKLPILNAVIRETIRCMQLVTGRIPVVCPDDLRYKGWTIPAGTSISMCINDVLLDPTIYENPHKFDPQRWLDLDDKGNEYLHGRLDRWFVAFSRGPRACQGQDVSWAVMYRGLSTIFRRYDLTLYNVDYDRDIRVVSDCFFGEAGAESKGIRFKVRGLRA